MRFVRSRPGLIMTGAPILAAALMAGMVIVRRGRFHAPPLRWTSDDFQAAADTLRLRHLAYHGKLIDEYQAQTGRYPLQESLSCRTTSSRLG